MTVYGRYAQRMLAETSLDAAEPAVQRGLQTRLDELLAHATRPVQMLDAGCGRRRAVPVANDRYVVGVDLSEDQLAHNEAVDEAIIGDIQVCDLGGARFDAVFCWYVLEHLDNPEKALLNLWSALKPNGVLILAVPHARSVRGLVTRFTPHWFHKWIRGLLGGSIDRPDPFPTVMSSAIMPRRLCAFAQRHNLTVEFSSEFECWEQKKLRAKLKLTGGAFQIVEALVRTLSVGVVTIGVTDAIVVMQKRG